MGLNTSRSPALLKAESNLDNIARMRNVTEDEIYRALGRLVSAALRMPGRVAARRAMNESFVLNSIS